ncbi:trihelix transcription factor GT-3b-like isoform X2 [Hibiscus syriacus]|uniref:trihelix transcription factor GT-3b-like isoform X1 n=1 Tax=Hibiscus syriacus TaxID=106335 RepID=UPI001922F3D6|nr:trihelix transcription factor GT-3b-like isoform X1 [Hibiscus syriacus]XP_039019374.1 trihelix transcription factor GT-3b-like isoform X2 [Hibiscus syriacus]
MEGHHHRHHHLQNHPVSANVEAASDRFPQWSLQETKEFLSIRAELDQSFMETKRNKLLWEVISTRMRDKGYNRSAEQCKCKWKNLVTRYKGCGTIEAEAARQQFPFYDDLQAIFTARMQSILCSESEGGGGGGATRKMSAASDEEEDTEENELDDKYSVRKKKKVKIGGTGTSGGNNDIKQILEDFMRQQLQMEMQWREAFESRENERRSKEIEWRQTMEALENERMMMERRWREREEQRRMREEARAEKRDALITTLLNKLRREGQM